MTTNHTENGRNNPMRQDTTEHDVKLIEDVARAIWDCSENEITFNEAKDFRDGFGDSAYRFTIEQAQAAMDVMQKNQSAEIERLRAALNDGLDLCVRARRMSEQESENPDLPMWFEQAYQNDLAAWEARAKQALKGGQS